MGVKIDGYGNLVNEEEKKKIEDTNPNLLVLNTDKGLSLGNDEKKKEFKSIKDYSPSGNLVYNKDLLTKIEDKFNS